MNVGQVVRLTGRQIATTAGLFKHLLWARWWSGELKRESHICLWDIPFGNTWDRLSLSCLLVFFFQQSGQSVVIHSDRELSCVCFLHNIYLLTRAIYYAGCLLASFISLVNGTPLCLLEETECQRGWNDECGGLRDVWLPVVECHIASELQYLRGPHQPLGQREAQVRDNKGGTGKGFACGCSSIRPLFTVVCTIPPVWAWVGYLRDMISHTTSQTTTVLVSCRSSPCIPNSTFITLSISLRLIHSHSSKIPRNWVEETQPFNSSLFCRTDPNIKRSGLALSPDSQQPLKSWTPLLLPTSKRKRDCVTADRKRRYIIHHCCILIKELRCLWHRTSELCSNSSKI